MAAISPDLTACTHQSASPWHGLSVAVIDDAMHMPSLGRTPEGERPEVEELLTTNNQILQELASLGADNQTSVDERLRLVAEAPRRTMTQALLGSASKEVQRMIEEHQSYRRLIDMLRGEVSELLMCDPYQDMPDLSGYNLVLLDYYLDGSSGTGDRAVGVAASIRAQAGRVHDQQIVLMSSLESVRKLRTEFLEKTGIAGSSFAFVAKADLDESWKVKAHLGMLDRARPYSPALTAYRETLADSLAKASAELLGLVDDLDIGDYAFLQGQALMKDGHPLGDYVFWLLSSQLMTLAFEREEMRTHQRDLDRLEFVGEPFAATEPSTVVANLFHSALVSRNVGPLGPHPRAQGDGEEASYPLVQLGDVFLDDRRSKALVVMSADCDLAFSPHPDRQPDGETPVILVPGTPVRLREELAGAGHRTEGLLDRGEVYRINWTFAKYRSVPLKTLKNWLVENGYNVANRDRLRPLFGLKLQQEFGAHLLRVGPPLLPPMTTKASGRVFVCDPEKHEHTKLDHGDLMISRFKDQTLLRITPRLAGILKAACEDLYYRLGEKLAGLEGRPRENQQKKIDSLRSRLDEDAFWIDLLNGVALSGKGQVKTLHPLAMVLGNDWPEDGKPRVMLEILEELPGEITPRVQGSSPPSHASHAA